MGLWEDAQRDAERAQVSRSAEANKREAEWADWNARRQKQVVVQQQAIAEFLDGIARLAVSPQKFPVYEWRTGLYDGSNVRCGEILGWDLFAWTEPGTHGATRFVILSPSGELFDTSLQRGAAGKSFFGRTTFAPRPSPCH
jgi:hypothetical protein